jgi:hypothetical protein
MSDAIQGLWIGPRLSVMEQLSIGSFLRHGHQYHLYLYDDVAGVPTGTSVKDANDILSQEMIFRDRTYNSYTAFADYFRYKLLFSQGGYWVDLDVICLKPFVFDAEYVFSSEVYQDSEVVNVNVIKAPPQSTFAYDAWMACKRKDKAHLSWGELGPWLANRLVAELGLHEYVAAPHVFCPIPFNHWYRVLSPSSTYEFDDNTCAVHLWNEMWRRNEQDKNISYHPECLYERLKKTYL